MIKASLSNAVGARKVTWFLSDSVIEKDLFMSDSLPIRVRSLGGRSLRTDTMLDNLTDL